jgi:hypothetical protein
MSEVKKPVIISFDLWCSCGAEYPAYRLYVDNQLMTERTYIWKNPTVYITEVVPLLATTGKHTIRIERVKKVPGEFQISDFKVNDQSHPITARMEFYLEPEHLRR